MRIKIINALAVATDKDVKSQENCCMVQTFARTTGKRLVTIFVSYGNGRKLNVVCFRWWNILVPPFGNVNLMETRKSRKTVAAFTFQSSTVKFYYYLVLFSSNLQRTNLLPRSCFS